MYMCIYIYVYIYIYIYIIENVIIPTDEVIFFRGVGIPSAERSWLWQKKKDFPYERSTKKVDGTTIAT